MRNSTCLCCLLAISCAFEPVVVLDDMVLVATDGVTAKFYDRKNVVTVAQFREFVGATGYIPQAETFGNAGIFNQDSGVWQMCDGASWEFPYGKNAPALPDNRPVTRNIVGCSSVLQVKNRRPPTVAEWELAACQGNTYQLYA